MARAVVPIADLRRTPEEILPKDFSHNDLRDSQLLFNEEIKILKTQGEWVYIAALEQLRFTEKRGWHPYEGWVHQTEIGEGTIAKKSVVCEPCEYPYGTFLDKPIPGSRLTATSFDRRQLIEEAKQFLGAPYLWGGRSSYLPGHIGSVDCSSLVHLLYRAQGIFIPRDAHDQFLFGKPASTLQPGDPLYLAKEERVSHVILKLEEDLYIEAPETGKKVRLLREGVDVWQSEGRWHIFDRPNSYKGFYRSPNVIISNESTIEC